MYRQSLAPGGSGGSSLTARLAAKKEELRNLQQLELASAQLVDQLEAMKDKIETMADGAQAIGEVMNNWQKVLRAVSLASTGVRSFAVQTETGEEEEELLPEALVRIRDDE
uniref:DASH complex subunit DAD2 n=1 Tax=Blastobotrys adeninivorans TaxID=409370 RepID=A0A060T671_BLAAD